MLHGDPRYWLRLIRKATPGPKRFRTGSDSDAPVDGPALARRRRDFRKAYQARNDRPSWAGRLVAASLLLIVAPLMLLLVAMFVGGVVKLVWGLFG